MWQRSTAESLGEGAQTIRLSITDGVIPPHPRTPGDTRLTNENEWPSPLIQNDQPLLINITNKGARISRSTGGVLFHGRKPPHSSSVQPVSSGIY